MTVREALEKLNDLVDESDPDLDLPNIIHAFQAAERARAEFPEHDWLHLTALIHDLGKIMAFYGEPQWAVVGDTFAVGCRWGIALCTGTRASREIQMGIIPPTTPNWASISPIAEWTTCWCPGATMSTCIPCWSITRPSCPMWRATSFGSIRFIRGTMAATISTLRLPRMRRPRSGCWSSSEFILSTHTYIPSYISNPSCSRYDLYTKSEVVPDIEALWPYYQTLIDKYLPGVLEF